MGVWAAEDSGGHFQRNLLFISNHTSLIFRFCPCFPICGSSLGQCGLILL